MNRFSIGDLVKICYSDCENFRGKVGEITDICNNMCKVEFSDITRDFWIEEQFLEYALDNSLTILNRLRDATKNFIIIRTKTDYRIDKTNNTRIKTCTTEVYTNRGNAEVTCDESEYSHKDGAWIACAKIMASLSEEFESLFRIAMKFYGSDISNVIISELADKACGDNFDKAYKRWVKNQHNMLDKMCICKTCGAKFESSELARKHEKWHIENKKAKHERYMIRYEAKRRLTEEKREKAIKDAMNAIVEKTNNVK